MPFLIALALMFLGGHQGKPALASACAHRARASTWTALPIRMDREQVEFWQNVEWSHGAARAAPYPITSLPSAVTGSRSSAGC